MFISSNSLLNIIIPNENKVLKEALQEADKKGLSNKAASNVQDVLKNLFGKLSKNNQSSNDLSKLLKNSSVFKDLGQISSNLKQLSQHLENTPSLNKYSKNIEIFLKDITQVNDKTLKTTLNNSGIFLESKLSKLNKTNNLLPKVQEVLLEIKNALKNNDSKEAKNITKNIEDLLNTKNIPKEVLKQTLSKISSQLTHINQNSPLKNVLELNNKLEKLSQNISLLTSKQNNHLEITEEKTQLQKQTKEVLTNLKTELSKESVIDKTHLIKEINKLLQKDTFTFTQNTTKVVLLNILSTLEKNTQLENKNLFSNIKSLIKNIETNIESKNENIQKQSKTLLNTSFDKISSITKENFQNSITQIKTLIKDEMQKPLLLKQVQENSDELQKPLLLKQVQENSKNVSLNNDKNIPLKNQNNSFISNKAIEKNNDIQMPIKNTSKELLFHAIKIIETKIDFPSKQILDQIKTILGNENSVLKEDSTIKTKINTTINESFSKLKTHINTLKNILSTSNIPNKVDLVNIMEKLSLTSSLQDFVETSKLNNTIFSNNSTSLDSLIKNLKDFISAASFGKEQDIYKVVKELEELNNNNKNLTNKDIPAIKDDLKASLLMMKEDMLSHNISKEAVKQIDKLLVQIEYQQLLSLSTQSSSIYLPFVWDMLEEGTISYKEIKKDRFFVEINLSLKDLGNLRILLALYDENKLDITLYAQKNSFRNLFNQEIKSLKQAINKAGLIPNNIKILDLEETQNKNKRENLYLRSFNELSLGLDIKA
ncbi:MAG: flagellar hook-length control protein FliK [Campylobacteraceae bacterium]|nr:flagellar hook-length control protein FliK [Campylobacteraceae bacterium]